MYVIEIVHNGPEWKGARKVEHLINAKDFRQALFRMELFERFVATGPSAWADGAIAADRQDLLAEMTGYVRWVIRIREVSTEKILVVREYAWNVPQPREYIPRNPKSLHLLAISLINARKKIGDRHLYLDMIKGNRKFKAPLP